mmetsp:Transcript_85758/g.262423  ORF Transcript_85758/g.262423 Transcript_85758/m.262423 type:complete len:200 (-) Transcript_85758:522-1121(-)
MHQRHGGRGPASWLQDEQGRHEVSQRPVALLHEPVEGALLPHVTLRRRRRRALRPMEAAPAAVRLPRHELLLSGQGSAAQHPVGKRLDGTLHQGEVLQAFVRAEQELSCVELHQDAAHRPQVRALVPTHRKDHLRSAVLSRIDDGRVMLQLVSRIPEVDELHFVRSWSHVLRLHLALLGIVRLEVRRLSRELRGLVRLN